MALIFQVIVCCSFPRELAVAADFAACSIAACLLRCCDHLFSVVPICFATNCLRQFCRQILAAGLHQLCASAAVLQTHFCGRFFHPLLQLIVRGSFANTFSRQVFAASLATNCSRQLCNQIFATGFRSYYFWNPFVRARSARSQPGSQTDSRTISARPNPGVC